MKTPVLPDMGSVGEAAAKMPDQPTVMFYFLLVLIVAFMAERAIAGWRHGRTAEKFAAAAEKLSDVMRADSTQVTVQMALIQKELTDARLERHDVRETINRIDALLEGGNLKTEPRK